MIDVSETLQAKSDQLNAIDIMGCNRIVKIRDIKLKIGADQPLSIYFDGDNNRPWKPAKCMRIVLANAWGRDASQWIGRYSELFFDETVIWAGKPVGGIRIKALSDIAPAGITCAINISQGKRAMYHVDTLTIEAKEYPQDKFEKALPSMAKMMLDGEMTLQQIIARCHKTGTLTAEQLAELESHAPIEIDNNEDEDIF